MMKKLLLFTVLATSIICADILDQPVVTAEKYIAYKKANGYMEEFVPPKVVLICYQKSLLDFLLKQNPKITLAKHVSDLYFLEDNQVAILGGWGIGAPALSNRLEQLIALGVKKIIAVGTAGTLLKSHNIGDFVLSTDALAEDGVSHLYLPEGTPFAKADSKMVAAWKEFATKQSIPSFHQIPTWSFSALFRETPRHIRRVTALGCGVVEMEAATLFAIGQEKGVQTMTLFVISDSVTEEAWTPHVKEPYVKNNLYQLANWALDFCKYITSSSVGQDT